MSVEGIKYNLNDEDIESLSEKIKELIEVKYKDEFSSVPDHIKSTLCQNFTMQLRNNNMDIDTLLNEAGITDE